MVSIDIVKKLIDDRLKELNYILCSLTYKNKEKTLEIVIDKEEPINLDDITNISNEISNILDNNDFTNDSYTLDVSSLGVEKPIDIKNLEKYVGKYVNLHTTHPVKGMSYIEGEISSVTENDVEITCFVKGKKTKYILEKEFIDKGNLAIKF